MQTDTPKLGLTARIFIGMLVGIIFGTLIRSLYDEQGDFAFNLLGMTFSTNAFIVDGLLYTVGQIFIASLKMLVVPLVFVSLVCGVHGLSDPTKLGRLGGKAILLYVVTTAIAITTAAVAHIITSNCLEISRELLLKRRCGGEGMRAGLTV